MHDDLTAHEGRDGQPAPACPSRERLEAVAHNGPATRREWPIARSPLSSLSTPDLVHAWLDGEIPESSVHGAEAVRHVDFWKRVDHDLEVVRQCTRPRISTERDHGSTAGNDAESGFTLVAPSSRNESARRSGRSSWVAGTWHRAGCVAEEIDVRRSSCESYDVRLQTLRASHGASSWPSEVFFRTSNV